MALFDPLALALGYITLLSGQRQSKADARNDKGGKTKDGRHHEPAGGNESGSSFERAHE
jgi:hypothetical protein